MYQLANLQKIVSSRLIMRKAVFRYCLFLLFSILGTKAFSQSEGLLNDPVLPDSLLNDRYLSYQYYKTHFWDECKLNDSLLYGNPAYAKRLDAFFDKVVAPLPDSINTEIDRLMGKIGNKTVRDFTLWYLLNKYEHPEYMTHDKVFIHLADDYFLVDDSIEGLNEANRFFIAAQSGNLKRLALFQPAPELCLHDTNNQYIETQSIETDYLILFFYDHDCEVCQAEAKDLKALVQRRNDVKIYAVDMNYDFRPIDESFINVSAIAPRGLDPTDAYSIENTPLIYVLDKEKRIIAKKLKAEQVELFLEFN